MFLEKLLKNLDNTAKLKLSAACGFRLGQTVILSLSDYMIQKVYDSKSVAVIVLHNGGLSVSIFCPLSVL